MSYTAIDNMFRAPRADGDVPGKVSVGLLKKAAVRAAAIGTTDKKEAQVCVEIIEGNAPESWAKMVLYLLDSAGVLATPTDAQVDTAVDSAWAYFLASRVLTR